MAVLQFFHPTEFYLVADLVDDLINHSYTEQPYGSLDGTIEVEVTGSNATFLESLDELSHWVKASPQDSGVVGGFVKNAYIDKGICYISVMGFLELLELVQAIASHQATAMGEATAVAPEDPSWTKIFYADSVLGLYQEIFINLEASMIAQGYQPFFQMVGIAELVESLPAQEWSKSYRLNSLEIPKMSEIYRDLTEDDEFLPVAVELAAGSLFKFSLRGISSYSLTVIDEAQDDVFDVSIDRGERLNRAFSLAAGTDTKENNLVSKIEFNSSAIYSAAFSDTDQKATLDIARANRATIAGADVRLDQLNFTAYTPDLPIFSAVRISGENLEELLAVITKKKVEAQEVTYTATIVSSVDELIPGIKMPTSELRRLIYEPAIKGNRRVIRQGMEKSTPTGWR